MYEEVFPVFMENVYYEKNTQEFQGLFFFPHQNKKKNLKTLFAMNGWKFLSCVDMKTEL